MKGLCALMVFVCTAIGAAALLNLRSEAQVVLGLNGFGLAAVFMILLGILRRLPPPEHHAIKALPGH